MLGFDRQRGECYPYSQKFNDIQNKVAKDTGHWMIEVVSPLWFSPSEGAQLPVPSLWIHGAVGCGKSVLCSTLIEQLRTGLGRPEEVAASVPGHHDIVAFVFFAFDEPALHSLDAVLRVLLVQMCIGNAVPEDIDAMYEHNYTSPSEVKHESTLLRVLQRFRADHESTPSDSGSSARVRSVTFVMDALDELPPIPRGKILNFLGRLQRFGQESADFPIRLALFTRRELFMERFCLKETGWKIEAAPALAIEGDIKVFVRSRIEEYFLMQLQSEEEKQRTVQVISNAAQGMFRLAALYMDELVDWDCEDLPETYLEELLETSNLPKDLDTYYELILKRIRPIGKMSDMFVILKWMLVAARPMTVAELLDACATLPLEGGRGDFDIGRRRTCQDFAARLNGLVSVAAVEHEEATLSESEYTEPTPTSSSTLIARFAHFSVREYLLRIEPLGWPTSSPRYDLDLAQSYAAKCCLTYLTQCNNAVDGRTEMWPLRSYAWNHWAMHAAAHDTFTDMTTFSQVNAHVPSLRSQHLSTRQTSDSLKMFNRIASPWLYARAMPPAGQNTHQGQQELPHSDRWVTSSDGRLLNVLQDPEFPFDFRPDALASPSERPLYPERGRPDMSHQLFWALEYSDSIRRTEEADTNEELDVPRRPRFSFTPLPSPLPAIRLLVLHPSEKRSSAVVCSLHTDSLENRPQYTALSYEWSYTDRAATVVVNGRYRIVNTSLHSALQDLRQKTDVQVLWVDVLCMSMMDLAERGSQVGLMNQIYSNAVCVTVWLGPGDYESEACMLCLGASEIAEAQTQTRPAIKPCPSCLEQIFAHQIWRKTWILLEFVLATELVILWGHHRLQWNDAPAADQSSGEVECRYIEFWTLHLALGTSDEPQFPPPMSPAELMKLYRDLRSRWARSSGSSWATLPELLYLTRHLSASEPKDKILTMIHLLGREEREAVKEWIDYNLSFVDMSVSVAKYCLDKMKNLDILSINSPRYRTANGTLERLTMSRGQLLIENRLDGLPSWVPAWHCLHWNTVLASGSFGLARSGESDTRNCSAQHDFVVRDRMLSIKGCLIETIQYISTIAQALSAEPFQGRLSLSLTPSINTDEVSHPASLARYATPGAQREALLRTVLASDTTDDPRFPQPVSESWYPGPQLWSDAKQAEKTHTGQRNLARGSIGHVGLVPSWSVVGDIIVALKGGSMLYVLRERPDGHYTLIGEWYISRSPLPE
ncbi:hypothetical protein LTR53_000810 [Teratosphaeriaceae sp. CCFEE 6253]|nr:hypothetical protein LTR53_000810 [Teratosphaeriaceae sp. CCFEE 6253]